MNFSSQTIWMLNLVVPLIIVLLIKLENHLILFHFFLLEAQSITFSYITNYGHGHTAIHIFGTRGLRSWKIDNTGIFLDKIIIPTHVYKLVEQVLFLCIKLVLMQEIKMHFLINSSIIIKRELKLMILQTYPSLPQFYRSPPHDHSAYIWPLFWLFKCLFFLLLHTTVLDKSEYFLWLQCKANKSH